VGSPQQFTITVNPTPAVVDPANQTICSGSNTTAINFVSLLPGTTFDWTNNNPSIGLAGNGTGNIPSFVAIGAGSNPVSATITVVPKLNNCTGTTQTFSITVIPLPVAPVITAGVPAVTCQGGTITLTSSITNGNQWFKDGVAITNATSTTLVATANGNYSVKATANSCSSNSSNVIHVNFPALPIPVITSVSPSMGIAGTTVVITGFNFSSTPSDNLVSFNGITATITTATTTSLTVIVPSGAKSDKISVTVCNQKVLSPELFTIIDETLVIYDLITPYNTDGINDQFKIENIDLTVTNKVTLMDRYGVVVKEWNNFRNYDDLSTPNQDKFDFKQLSPGTYVCILNYQMSVDSPAQSLTQVITLLKDK
jgi:hypothetical protein